MSDTLAVLRYSALAGVQDLRALYTWKTWTAGWLLRVICQTLFFGLIGRLLGSRDAVHYLVVGNAMMAGASTVLMVVQATTWERMTGTLPLLIAAPATPMVVLFGRTSPWIPDAFASAMASFLVAGWVFDVPMPWPRVLWVVPLALLVSVSTYVLGTFFGSLVLRFVQARNFVSNVVSSAMMVLCGVNVPLSYLPGWARGLGNLLPLTHGLAATRQVLAGSPSGGVLRQVGLEIVVAVGWFLASAASFRWFAEGGRRDGSIELSA